MRLQTILLSALALAMLAAPAAAEPELPADLTTAGVAPETLRYRFTAGEVRHTKEQVVQTLSFGGDAKGSVATTLDSVRARTTRNVAPGGTRATIEVAFSDFGVGMTANGKSFPKAQLAPLVKAVKGISATHRMTHLGTQEASNVEHVPAHLRTITDGLVAATVGAEPVFPEKAIGVGDTFEQRVPVEMNQAGMALTLDYGVVYTHRGVVLVNGRRFVVLHAAISMTLPKKTLKVRGRHAVVNGSGSGTAVLRFDVEGGHIHASALKLDQTIEIETGTDDAPELVILKLATTATTQAVAGPKKTE